MMNFGAVKESCMFRDFTGKCSELLKTTRNIMKQKTKEFIKFIIGM